MKFAALFVMSMMASVHSQAFDFMSEVAGNMNANTSTNIKTSASLNPVQTTDLKITTPRPQEWPVAFTESDFETKRWIKEFPFVVVVNKATEGQDKQSIRVYKQGHLLSYEEIYSFMRQYQTQEIIEFRQQTQLLSFYKDPQFQDKKPADFSERDFTKALELDQKQIDARDENLKDLKKRIWAPGVFKVSTGRDEFEVKGTHHSQKDSWTVTPSGFFTPQFFDKKHKSESYSSSLCDSIFGKLVGAIAQKEMCTYMENAIFFNGAIALHSAIPGTETVLGNKASGGCVRLPSALAEYLYLNIMNEKGGSYPVVNPDGTVKRNDLGQIIYSGKANSIWGEMSARGALIIVQSQVVK